MSIIHGVQGRDCSFLQREREREIVGLGSEREWCEWWVRGWWCEGCERKEEGEIIEPGKPFWMTATGVSWVGVGTKSRGKKAQVQLVVGGKSEWLREGERAEGGENVERGKRERKKALLVYLFHDLMHQWVFILKRTRSQVHWMGKKEWKWKLQLEREEICNVLFTSLPLSLPPSLFT